MGATPAVGLHDQDIPKPPKRREAFLEALKVLPEYWPDVGIDHGGAEPVEFLDLGDDFVGKGGISIGETGTDFFRN